MNDVDQVDADVAELDAELGRAVVPDPTTLARLRRRIERSTLASTAGTGHRRAGRWRVTSRWLPAVAAAGILLLAGGVAAAGASALINRSDQHFSSSVIPAPLAGGGQATANPSSAQYDRVQAGTPALAPQFQSGLVPNTGPCGAAPTVQFQGRGLAATGVAAVSSSGAALTNVNVNVSTHGADAAAATSAATTAIAATESALQAAGVPAADIHRNSFGVSTDFQTKQMVVNAGLQATVSPDLASKATSAVAQVPGVSGYWIFQAAPPDSTPEQVKSAMADAASRAKEMAAAAAQATGVNLGSVESVVAQPPAVCGYGASGPQRVVQVTVTYSLK